VQILLHTQKLLLLIQQFPAAASPKTGSAVDKPDNPLDIL
jgi:hypothetical protein